MQAMVQYHTLPFTLLHLLLTTGIITIGITPEILQQTTLVGQLQKLRNQFTTHVQPVGVFLTEIEMVYGQRQDLIILHTTVQMKEYLSASHLLQKLGILLRGVATTSMAAWAMSVTAASIGLPLLTAAARSTCASATMASSIRLTTAIARTVNLSVVSKNQNKS